ncbi:hypothetical protein PoB_001859300 [Plakobranchus ocellatus]|uniref:Uncharacterized protein n=1 Tax=Plakobranchus ocellatus TaxID=259542 RepID=A0AAV3ZBI8_9GAST|nr:hypothetical protein PoB_001859300 [Plakobranchus ocellatus]
MAAKPTQRKQHGNKTYSAGATYQQNLLSGDNMATKTHSAETTYQRNPHSKDNMLAKPTQRRQHTSETHTAKTTC